MSDGNFNRALLPHTPFYNGLTIGRKQGLQIALQAFEEYLRNSMPEIDKEELTREKNLFSELYTRHL